METRLEALKFNKLGCKSNTQVLTKEEFVHLPPGEVDTQQDAEQDSEYMRE